MKLILTHSSALPTKRELYEALAGFARERGHEIFLPQKDGKREVVTRELVGGAGVVLAEVSYPSTGQGIELGWADAQKIRVVCIFEEGTETSPALRYITEEFIGYRDLADLQAKLGNVL